MKSISKIFYMRRDMGRKFFTSSLKLTVLSLLLCTQGHAVEDCSWFNLSCPSKVWLDVDYLNWAIKDSPKVVPLVVQSTSAVIAGSPVLAMNQTPLQGNTILIGGEKFKSPMRSGVQVAVGCWFDDCSTWGVEVSYFFLEKKSREQEVASSGLPGTPLLVLPFFDTSTNLESSTPLAATRPISSQQVIPFGGTMSLKVSNEMQGAELNGLWNMDSLIPRNSCTSCSCSEVSLIGGFRYWNFNENLTFSTNIPNATPPIDTFITTDKFDVKNNFFAGQVGLKFKYFFDKFYVKATGKLALGAMCEELTIKGQLITNDFNTIPFTGEPVIYPAGYLGFPTNNGKHRKTTFAVMPEVDVRLGYQILDCLNLEVGYTFFTVNKMIRATNQIDRNINSTQAPAITGVFPTTLVGPETPKALMKTTTFWAQGLTASLKFIY